MSGCSRNCGGRAGQHDAAVLQHVGVVGHIERDRRVLLDQQHGHAEVAADRLQAADQAPPPPGARDPATARRPAAVAARRPAPSQSPASGARRRTGSPASRVRRRASAGKYCHTASARRRASASRRGHHGLDVLGDRQALEHLAALGHQRDAARGDLVRRPVVNALAAVRDGATGDARIVQPDEARDRAQRGGLAGAVGARAARRSILRAPRATRPARRWPRGGR